MVFSSIIFLFYFLPAFMAAYLLLFRVTAARNLVFLAFSLIFYAWGEAVYVLVMIGSIVGNYLFGRLIARQHTRAVLALGVGFNLALLFWFKYAAFAVSSVTGLGNALSLTPQAQIDVHLPLGISFFTFQAISYLIDIYRDDARVERSFSKVALYISMFPQLIAGPIVRFRSIQDQLHARRISVDAIYRGAQLFIVGLAQKVLIADTMALPADQAFALPAEQLGTAMAWVGVGAYSLQIYFDFAGYSTMAIGLGLMAGFRLPQNFNYPYVSQSLTEFWRRWHMTLSSWFRDYLYIPLGGNRHGKATTIRNLLIVFVLCGLWHGAAWSFLVWGLWHGGFLILERLGLGRLLSLLYRPMRHLYLLLVVAIGWVFFRAADLGHATDYLAQMFGLGAGGDLGNVFGAMLHRDSYVFIVAAVGIVFSTPICGRITGWREMGDEASYAAVSKRTQVLHLIVGPALAALAILVMVGQTSSPFIYFRF